jgi:hypothetical protein
MVVFMLSSCSPPISTSWETFMVGGCTAADVRVVDVAENGVTDNGAVGICQQRWGSPHPRV